MHSILENATVLRDFFPLSWTATRLKVGNTWVLTWQWWWNEAGNPRRPRQHAIFIRTVAWWSFHLFRILNDWLTYPDLPFYFIYFYTAVCNRPKQDQLGCYLAVYCSYSKTMSFICCETPLRKRQSTSGKILLTLLVSFIAAVVGLWQWYIYDPKKYGDLSPASLSGYDLWSLIAAARRRHISPFDLQE